jgi:glycine hydroxymethyltransferase
MSSESILETCLKKEIPGYNGGAKSAEAIAFAAAFEVIGKIAPEIVDAIRGELANQRSHLKLIASENYASPAVLLAMGNWMTDKYSEGYPGHRNYAGCEYVDKSEARAQELACSLFGADHAYLQPHSGIDANMVAFWTVLTHRIENPALERLGVSTNLELSDAAWEKLRLELGNQKMMGMALDAGGHLTHGFRLNVSGKLFRHCAYSVDPESGTIDYDDVRKRAKEEKPLLIIAGYSAYPRKINFRIFREIADEVGATLMVDMAHFAGLVAGKVFTGDFDPVAHAHIVTTTTHKTLRGPRGGMILCKKELAETVNRGCPLVLGGPLQHMIAAKGVALAEASTPDFRAYAQKIVDNAQALGEAFMEKGVKVLTGGTDNHMILVDVRPLGLNGRHAESALVSSGVTVNRNSIPSDPNGAWYTSGLRLGTPALTTLGMGADEMKETADIIYTVLKATKPAVIATGKRAGKPSMAKFELDEKTREATAGRVKDLLGRFPLYPMLDL